MVHTLPLKKTGSGKRRKVIIYILTCILILGIVAGFTNTFITDNRKFSAPWGETIVMEAEPPATGTPEDYDLISNLKFTAYKLHHASYFRGETVGDVVADIKLGSYRQSIHNTRYVQGGNKVLAETISSSSLKSLAEQKYAEDGIIIYRPSVSIGGSSATFSSTAYQMSYEEYSTKYGSVPNQLTKYIIKDNTVIGCADENAMYKPAANAAEDSEGGFDFYVPEGLTRGGDGLFRFSLVLDPLESTLYYRNEVRTLGGADQNPKFYSTRIIVTIDEKWNPISVRAIENYDIAIPVLGAMNCTSDITEYFTQVDDENGVIPEEDFYRPYIERAKDDPNYVPPDIPDTTVTSPSDYLATAFADYLSGEKTLDLKVDVAMGDFSAYDITASINLGTMQVRAAIGSDLYVIYDGDRVYLSLNKINGYLSIEDFNKLMKDERLGALLGAFEGISADSIFGGDMLTTLFENCEMTVEDGVAQIRLQFELDLSSVSEALGKVQVDASLFIEDESKSLQAITGKVGILGKTLNISVAPLKYMPRFPSFDGAVDLSGILDFIPDAVNTFTQKTFSVDGSVTVNGLNIGVSAYIDVEDGVKADALLSVLGLDISVKYANGELLVELGDIKVKGEASELPALLNAVLSLVDTDKFSGVLSGLIPKSLNAIVDMLDYLVVTDDTLTIGLKALSVPVEINITRGGGYITGIALDAGVDLLGIQLDLAAKLSLSHPEKRAVDTTVEGEYITVPALSALITNVKPYLEANSMMLALGGSVEVDGTAYTMNGGMTVNIPKDEKPLELSGRLSALGQDIDVTYADDTAYVALGKIKIKLDLANLDKLTSPAKELISLIKALGGIDGMGGTKDEVDLMQYIKRLNITANGAIELTLGIEGGEINITIDSKAGTLSARGQIGTVKLNLGASLAPSTSRRIITPPRDKEAYVELTEFGAAIETVAAVLREGEISAVVQLSVGGNTYAAQIQVAFNDGIKLSVKEETLPFELVYADGTAYITLADMKISGSLNDVTSLIEKIKNNLPSVALDYIEAAIETVVGMAENMPEIKIDVAAVLDGVLSAITELSAKDGGVTLGVSYGGVTVTAKCAFDLSSMSADVLVPQTLTGLDGDISFTLAIADLAAKADIAIPDAADFVKASDFVAVVSPLLPLMKEKALSFDLSLTLFGHTVTGSWYMDLGEYTLETVKAGLYLDIAGVPVKLSVVDLTLYADVNNGGMVLAQSLTRDGISALVTELAAALPQYDIAELIDSFLDTIKSALDFSSDIKAIDILSILNKIALYPVEGGFEIKVGLSEPVTATVLVDVDIDINVVASADGKPVTLSLNIAAEDEVISSLALDANILGTEFSFTASMTDASEIELAAPAEYIELIELVKYVAPIMDIVTDANGATAITLSLDAVIELMGRSLYIGGNLTVSFDPIAVSADIRLFNDTEYPQVISVVYDGNELYIETGTIRLSFNTARDLEVLYASIEKYIPDYLKDMDTQLDAMGGIMALVQNVVKLIQITDFGSALDILFDTDNIRKTSILKQLADTVILFKREGAGDVTIGVTVLDMPFALVVNATPTVTNSGELDVVIDTAVGGMMSLTARVSFEFVNVAPIKAPANADKYVPVVTFVKTVLDAINTFTAKADDIVTTDEFGNTTTVSQTSFELDTFTFDYDVFKQKTAVDEDGNVYVVVDGETGRPVIETDDSGNKIIEQHIEVANKNDNSGNRQSILRFGLTTTTVTGADGIVIDTTVSIALEAHLKLNILDLGDDGKLAAKTGFPIELDLYVAPTAEHPEGLAYLYYKEANGYGEKISIDFDSFLEIVAMLMDIVGADDETVDALLKDYRLPIDTTVFDYMAIAGFDTVRDLLNNMVKAINEAKLALSDITSVWDRFQNAGSLESLVEDFTNDDPEAVTIKSLAISAIDHIKAAIALFASDDESEPKDETEGFNSAMYEKVVNSIEFGTNGGTLFANVSNEIATGAGGTANVSVTSENDKVNEIGVTNLDANTARLNTLDVRFAPTQNLVITIPDDYTAEETSGNKVRYADLSNLKHLLLDVMNTANLAEFEIGGLDVSDSIKIKMSFGLDWLASADLTVKFKAQVKLVKVMEHGKETFKTAAAIEIYNQQSVVTIVGSKTTIVPECTTRLFFFDDILYIQGVKSWSESASQVVGTVTDIHVECSRPFSGTDTRYPAIKNDQYIHDTATFEYTEAMYTVDEFMWMIGNDIGKFFNEFLFYLIPLTSDKIMGISLRDIITDNITASNGSGANGQNTLAQIFKSYTYGGGAHNIVIGLAELAGSSSLNDLNLSITGMNDGDDNIFDNYVSSLHLDTSIASVLSVNLDATLRNVALADGGKTIYSKGFAPTGVALTSGKYSDSGSTYILDAYNYDRNALYTIDGLMYLSDNGNLYVDGNTLQPVLRPTTTSDTITWTSTANESRYCDSVYKVGDIWATYYYTATLAGYGYKQEGTDTYYVGTDASGNKYVYRMENGNQVSVQIKSIVGSVLAEVVRGRNDNIVEVRNRDGGIQWSRPWKAAYDSAHAA